MDTDKIILSINNVEELVFANPDVCKLLPDLEYLFKSWRLAVTGGLSHLAKKCLADFMARANEQHTNVLKEYFGKPVILRSLDYSLVANHQCHLDDVSIFESIGKSYGNFSISRDDSTLYICAWR